MITLKLFEPCQWQFDKEADDEETESLTRNQSQSSRTSTIQLCNFIKAPLAQLENLLHPRLGTIQSEGTYFNVRTSNSPTFVHTGILPLTRFSTKNFSSHGVHPPDSSSGKLIYHVATKISNTSV